MIGRCRCWLPLDVRADSCEEDAGISTHLSGAFSFSYGFLELRISTRSIGEVGMAGRRAQPGAIAWVFEKFGVDNTVNGCHGFYNVESMVAGLEARAEVSAAQV